MAEIVEGPWPKRQERRHARGMDAVAKLKGLSRLPLADRKRMARNLGEIIAALSSDLGVPPKVAMRQVFDNSGSGNNLAKRLKFVRFPSDAEKKSDEFSSSFADFLKLAKEALRLKPGNSMTDRQLEGEASLHLLAGTSKDPDPTNNSKFDFDAMREIGELADAFVQQVEHAVPGLKTYFERVAKYQLYHKPWPEEVYKKRFTNPVQDLPFDVYQYWSAELFGFIPVDVDTSKFFIGKWSQPDPFSPFVPWWSLDHRQVPSDESYEPIRGNSLPLEMLTDGSWIAGGPGVNYACIPGLLPRIYLGDIYPVARSEAGGVEFLRPTRVYLTLAPTLAHGSLKVRLAVISEAWPYDNTEYTFEDGRVYTGTSGYLRYIDGGSRWVERKGPIPLESLDLPDYSVKKVDFVPGVNANQTLGLQGHPDALSIWHQVKLASSLQPKSAPHYEAARTLFEKDDRFTAVGVAIEQRAGFTPFPATSLAAALISNLFYVKDEKSVLNMMIVDARSRVETLERQFQEWMADFQAVKSQFMDDAFGKNREK
jgi:hypothetical protein